MIFKVNLNIYRQFNNKYKNKKELSYFKDKEIGNLNKDLYIL